MEEIKQASKRLKAAREKVDEEYQQFVTQLDHEEERIENRYQALADKRSPMLNPMIEGTILAALLSGGWDRKLQRDNNGRIFLDVNSEAFQSIVDYLNELAISPPDNLPKTPTSRDAENQCNLDHLLDLLLKVQPLLDSTIITDTNQISQLHDWLGEDDSDGDFRLIYRSSRDGSSGFDFHSRCDNKGSTITIIETFEGYVFGGFSSTPWNSCFDSAESYLQSDKAFLFGLAGVWSPCKVKLKDPNSKCATLHYHEYGPSFGNCFVVYKSQLGVQPTHTAPYDISPLNNNTPERRMYAIKEVEVFHVHGDSTRNALAKKRATSFSSSINKALNEKIEALKRAEQQVVSMEKRFEEEVNFVETFASGDTKDVVKLNVSGTNLATKRSTLLVFEESVLAQQFDDSKWTEQGMGNASRHVKDWTPDDVFFWAQNIDDVPDDVATMFVENAITGNELLAMSMEGLQMIGIKRAGTLCLLLKEIKKLEEKASKDVATLVEHSPYCFKVILDYLRMKQLHAQCLVEAPDLPIVKDSERGRFEKVVEYYFPGDSAMLVLGMGTPITIKMAKVAQIDPTSSGETKDLLKDGRPLDKVTLVAAVQHFEEHEINAELGIEDGTGFMQVEIRLDSVCSDVCKENSYVRIIGQVEDFGGQRRIIASNVRPLSSGNELTNHFREVAQAYDNHLKQQEGARRKRKASPQRLENLYHQYSGQDSVRRLGGEIL